MNYWSTPAPATHKKSACVACVQMAAAAGVPIVLDAGGMDAPLTDALLQHITTLSPNETELQRLTGQQADSEAQVVAAAAALQQRARQLKPHAPVATQQGPAVGAAAGPVQQAGAGEYGGIQGAPKRPLQVLVKRGSAGSLMVGPDAVLEAQQGTIAASSVVDTTGGGPYL